MKKLTYKSSGVDIVKGDNLVSAVRGFAKSTKTKGVVSGIGSFGGLFDILMCKKMKNPVLVSSTDGVGTKLLIAQNCNKHDTVGFDLVGMCVNDVATTGAKPLFFLDYIATGKINSKTLKHVVKGIAAACKESGYALIGGETAEMPDMYAPDEYDLAGFCVGIADKNKIIDGKNIQSNDVILGLASNGIHSNGFSLVRKIFSKKEQKTLAKELLRPTRLYTKPLLKLADKISIKGIAHITGGSFESKVSRIIPKGLCAVINKKSWPVPLIFKQMQQKGNISEKEMYKVFNMGIGMVVVIRKKDVKTSQQVLSNFKIKSWVIGSIIKGSKRVVLA